MEDIEPIDVPDDEPLVTPEECERELELANAEAYGYLRGLMAAITADDTRLGRRDPDEWIRRAVAHLRSQEGGK